MFGCFRFLLTNNTGCQSMTAMRSDKKLVLPAVFTNVESVQIFRIVRRYANPCCEVRYFRNLGQLLQQQQFPTVRERGRQSTQSTCSRIEQRFKTTHTERHQPRNSHSHSTLEPTEQKQQPTLYVAFFFSPVHRVHNCYCPQCVRVCPRCRQQSCSVVSGRSQVRVRACVM